MCPLSFALPPVTTHINTHTTGVCCTLNTSGLSIGERRGVSADRGSTAATCTVPAPRAGQGLDSVSERLLHGRLGCHPGNLATMGRQEMILTRRSSSALESRITSAAASATEAPDIPRWILPGARRSAPVPSCICTSRAGRRNRDGFLVFTILGRYSP